MKFIRGTGGAILLFLALVVVACSNQPSPAPPTRDQPSDTPAAARHPAPRRSPPTVTPATAPSPAPSVTPGRLRLMAANLSSGNGQNYDLGHGVRILQGVKPDVVLIQEFNYRDNTAADIQSLANSVVGGSAHYYREAEAQVPNGVISRYPIRSSGEWDDPGVDNRDFAWACLDIPGPIDLWVVSVHLLTTKATDRSEEAEALVSFIDDYVPAADYLALGGDLNTNTRNEGCYAILNRVVITSGPYPVDHRGNSNTNTARTKPYDALFVDADLNRHRAAVVIGAESFANGLVVDPRVFTPIAAIAPATADDGNARSMQHMGVIKDFLVPSGGH